MYSDGSNAGGGVGDGAYNIAAYNPSELPRFGFGLQDGFEPLAGFRSDHVKYINGYLDGTVRPDAAISRAEAVSIIFRLLLGEDKNRPVPQKFSDVNMWDWYAQPVAHLANIGMITGYFDGQFKPEEPLTRAEFAVMLSRFDSVDMSMGMSMGMDMGMGMPQIGAFYDTAGHWAEAHINGAAQKGWITGYLDGSYRPDDHITRAELVAITNRVLYRGVQEADIPFWIPWFPDLPRTHWAYADIIEATVGHAYQRKENGYEIWTRKYND